MELVAKTVSDYIEKIAKENKLVVSRSRTIERNHILGMGNLTYYHGERNISFRILELCDDPLFNTARSSYRNLLLQGGSEMSEIDKKWLDEEEKRWKESVDSSLSIKDPEFLTKLHAILDPYIKMVSLLDVDLKVKYHVCGNTSLMNNAASGDSYTSTSMMPENQITTILNESEYTIDLVRGAKEITLDFNKQFNTKDPDLLAKIEQYIIENGKL